MDTMVIFLVCQRRSPKNPLDVLWIRVSAWNERCYVTVFCTSMPVPYLHSMKYRIAVKIGEFKRDQGMEARRDEYNLEQEIKWGGMQGEVKGAGDVSKGLIGWQLIQLGGTTPYAGGNNKNIQPHASKDSKRGPVRRRIWEDQGFNRGKPSLKASSSQKDLCSTVFERTAAVPSPRFNHTHLYCLAMVTKGPHLGRSEFRGSSQTTLLSGWQLL